MAARLDVVGYFYFIFRMRYDECLHFIAPPSGHRLLQFSADIKTLTEGFKVLILYKKATMKI